MQTDGGDAVVYGSFSSSMVVAPIVIDIAVRMSSNEAAAAAAIWRLLDHPHG